MNNLKLVGLLYFSVLNDSKNKQVIISFYIMYNLVLIFTDVCLLNVKDFLSSSNVSALVCFFHLKQINLNVRNQVIKK